MSPLYLTIIKVYLFTLTIVFQTLNANDHAIIIELIKF